MGLCFPEQQELDAIDDALRAEDPRLGSLFGIFTRLSRQEEMPRSERLGVAGRPPGGLRRVFGRWRKVPGRPDAGWLWAARAAPLAIIAALSVLFLFLTPNAAGRRCGHAAGPHGPVRAMVALGQCTSHSPAPGPGTPRP